MKEKIQKLAHESFAKLYDGLEKDDIKMINSALQFLNGACQAYIGYLSLLNYDDEKVGTEA